MPPTTPTLTTLQLPCASDHCSPAARPLLSTRPSFYAGLMTTVTVTATVTLTVFNATFNHGKSTANGDIQRVRESDRGEPSALSRTLSRALNITVTTVIAGQVQPIRTTMEQP